MAGALEIEVPTRSLEALATVIGPDRFRQLELGVERTRAEMGSARFWNVSSTSKGGGVAEMLTSLLGYARAGGIDARWMVIKADPPFFATTKRLHNRIHGIAGDDGPLGAGERSHYRDVLASNAPSILEGLEAHDVIVLHDPQTVGLAPMLAESGASVLWRCHIGADTVNAHTKEAWAFLAPFLAACEAHIFSRAGFVPPELADARVFIIPPSIDPFSEKNRYLSPAAVMKRLQGVGIIASEATSPSGTFQPAADRVRGSMPPFSADDRIVVQVSRWDHLKDMLGVMVGFADGVTSRSDAVLALAGPAVAGVSDDPEGQQVLGECIGRWEQLPAGTRRRIHLLELPMDDVVANALTVNALQRHASVVVQKSLMEGFGLTVAEALWKARPVIGSAVGGITDQLADGVGVLLDDPSDLAAFSDALVELLGDPERLHVMGARARRHVLDRFLGDRHLLQYADLIRELAGPAS